MVGKRWECGSSREATCVATLISPRVGFSGTVYLITHNIAGPNDSPNRYGGEVRRTPIVRKPYYLCPKCCQTRPQIERTQAAVSPPPYCGIYIYISPQALRENNSQWHPLLRRLSIDGLIKGFIIDYSDSFCDEFKDAVEAITNITALSHRHNPSLHLPTVAMSATFCIPEQKSFNTLFGAQAGLVSWGDTDKRSATRFSRNPDNRHTVLPTITNIAIG